MWSGSSWLPRLRCGLGGPSRSRREGAWCRQRHRVGFAVRASSPDPVLVFVPAPRAEPGPTAASLRGRKRARASRAEPRCRGCWLLLSRLNPRGGAGERSEGAAAIKTARRAQAPLPKTSRRGARIQGPERSVGPAAKPDRGKGPRIRSQGPSKNGTTAVGRGRLTSATLGSERGRFSAARTLRQTPCATRAPAPG